MDFQDEAPVDEIKRLRRCLNDLVSVLALPAMWSGREPAQIVDRLLDSLLGMLQLDLVYVRVNNPASGAPIEMARVAPSQDRMPRPEQLCQAIKQWCGPDPQKWPPLLRTSLGDRDISMVPSRIGLHAEIGVIVAGTARADFPIQTELLLLSVAANEAGIALQGARLLSEQKRVASELDRRVAQRTSELAQANEALHLQAALLQKVPVAAWTVNPDGTPAFVNQSWLEYTGQTLEFVQSSPEAWMIGIHPEDREEAARRFWDGIHTGQGFTMEVRFRRLHDGEYRWHLNRAVALRDEEGKVLRFVGTCTDIEDVKRSQENWKRAQEELRNTQAELAHMTRVMTMGELTASIAHEINQPLSGIITNANTCLRMLAADPPNVDGARETARRTIRDGNRASDVITRLRALFSKKDASTESVDLNEATREVIALSSSKLQKNKVILGLELADDLPFVTGDRVQLQQVILNLLVNASDAMSTVDGRPRKLLIKTEQDEGDRVRLTVKDTGVGFDPETAGRLFDAFYTTKDDGMGVGLSVSRSIIESHHGRLWAAQNDGPGATFAFSVPRGPTAATGADSIRAMQNPQWTEGA
jgi:PAS domain S-box-containing protein